MRNHHIQNILLLISEKMSFLADSSHGLDEQRVDQYIMAICQLLLEGTLDSPDYLEVRN